MEIPGWQSASPRRGTRDHLRRTRAFFEMPLAQKPLIFLWPSREEARMRLGRGLGFAIPQYYLIHSACDQSPGHELAHLFTHYLPGAQVKSSFVTEGASVMLDQTGRNRRAEAHDALVRLNTKTVDIAALWQNFSSAHFSISYSVAGLFCERFLTTFGKKRFLDFLRHQLYADACTFFGYKTIDCIIRETETMLNW